MKSINRIAICVCLNMFQLTWSGVPVNSSRFSELNLRNSLLNMVFSFLMRCASSTTTYFHEYRFNGPFSRKTISYEVTQTSQFLRTFMYSNVSERAVLSPINTTLLSDGQKRLISFDQFLSVEFGAITKCGPLFFLVKSCKEMLSNDVRFEQLTRTSNISNLLYLLIVFQITQHWDRLKCFACINIYSINKQNSFIYSYCFALRTLRWKLKYYFLENHLIFDSLQKSQKTEMNCIPKPISSAKMPLMPFSYNVINQFNARIW